MCTCTEKATGLKLAAKVIKKQTPKDKVVEGLQEGEECPRGGPSLLSPPVPLNAGPEVGALLHGSCYVKTSHRQTQAQARHHR